MRVSRSLPKPTPIRQESERLLARTLPKFNEPVPPVTDISESVMMLKENFVAVRNLFFLPWIAGMIIVLCLKGDEIYSAWKAEERVILQRVDLEIQMHGRDSLKKSRNPYVQEYVDLFDDGKLKFLTYIKEIRYSKGYVAYPDRNIEGDALQISIATTVIVLLGITSIRMRRRAPVHFDRDKRIVYTWRFGKVWAQRYDELGYFDSGQSMFLYLRFLDPEDESKSLWTAQYQIQPSGNPLWNARILQENVLTAIVKFMEQGRQSVWPTDWQGRKNFYIYEDKRPDDFERQLALILEKIEQERMA